MRPLQMDPALAIELRETFRSADWAQTQTRPSPEQVTRECAFDVPTRRIPKTGWQWPLCGRVR